MRKIRILVGLIVISALFAGCVSTETTVSKTVSYCYYKFDTEIWRVEAKPFVGCYSTSSGTPYAEVTDPQVCRLPSITNSCNEPWSKLSGKFNLHYFTVSWVEEETA